MSFIRCLNDILEETYGIMIYQEQVMEAAQKLAGYSLGKADCAYEKLWVKKLNQ